MRVTRKLLEEMVDTLNRSAGFNAIQERQHDGLYFLDMAYNGYKLSQYTKGSASREISRNGYGTARQLYDFLCVYVHPKN